MVYILINLVTKISGSILVVVVQKFKTLTRKAVVHFKKMAYISAVYNVCSMVCLRTSCSPVDLLHTVLILGGKRNNKVQNLRIRSFRRHYFLC